VLLEERRGLLERAGLAAGLVLGYSGPVQGLWRHIRLRVPLDNRAEGALRLGPLITGERSFGQSELKVREELGSRKISLEPVALSAIRVEHDQRGSPLRPEALERGGLFFNVNLDGDEMPADERADVRIRIDLGIQPSTCPSSGRRVEVQQERQSFLPRMCHRRIYFLLPSYLGHRFLLVSTAGSQVRILTASTSHGAIRRAIGVDSRVLPRGIPDGGDAFGAN
jgi:hypothetical protein